MRTRVNGEVGERLRQLLVQRARALGLTPGAAEVLRQAAIFDRWAPGDEIVTADHEGARVGFVVVGAARIVCDTPRGKMVSVCFVPPGRFLGRGWPNGTSAPPDDLKAIAHDPLGTIVATWTARTILEVFATLQGPNALQFAATLSCDATDVVRQKCHLLGLCLRDRVLAVLTTLAHDFGYRHPEGLRIELRLTHRDL